MTMFHKYLKADVMPSYVAPQTEFVVRTEPATPRSQITTIEQAVAFISNAIASATHSDEKVSFLFEAKDFTERVTTFLSDDLDRRLGSLRAEFAEVNLECRSSRDRLRKLQTESGQMQIGRMNDLRQKSSEAKARAKEVYDSKPNDDDFPTEDELRSWDARYKKASKVFNDAAAEQGQMQTWIAAKNMEIEKESAKLADLKQRRSSLKVAIEGKVASESGLSPTF